MLNRCEKYLLALQDRGVKMVPDDVQGIGSYATDYPGIRPDPDNPGFFLHGALTPEEEYEKERSEESEKDKE